MSTLPPTGTLLVVDDERAGREALEGLLLNQGYRLSFAASGAEALSRIRELRPDLVLLDVMMPGMDGFEVCRTLRADPAIAAIPVLLVTALDDRDTRLEGIAAGADDFISKPYDRGELRLRVKTIMRLGRYRRLLNERARFNSVVENASNGYIVVQDDGAISYANASARRFLTLDPPGPRGFGLFFEIARKQYRLEPDCAWHDVDLRVPNRHYLVRPETANASAFWLSITLMDEALNDADERLLRLQDVTEEMGLQRDRHSFQRIIGHKLRTPLNGMVSILEMLKEELAGGPQSDLAGIAFDSAERLARTVEEILQFASLSTQARLRDEPCPLATLPDLISRLWNEMGMDVVVSSIEPALLDRSITLSALQFETVCRELFENSRKFHPEGRPKISLKAVGLTEGLLRLTLRDNGVHLSPDQLAQVWTPYYQGEKRATGEVEGMGLGLSVVKSIVVSKSGTIRMGNNPEGPGIEVTLDLPLV